MLQAIYQEPKYIFYVTTEDRRINRSLPVANLRYLFKFTNNMSGDVKWSFGQNQEVFDRYTKVEFYPNDTVAKQPEDPYLGLIDLWENGYWNYEVYECSSETVIPTLTNCNAPLSPFADFGSFTVSDFAGNVLVSDVFTNTQSIFYNQYVDNLDGTSDIPITELNPIVQLSSCGVQLGTQGIRVKQQVLPVPVLGIASQFITFENCVQTSTGITFDVRSDMPIGYSYSFRKYVGSVPTEVDITEITTNPQTTSHSLAEYIPYSSGFNLVEMITYSASGGGASGLDFGTYYDLNPLKKQPARFGHTSQLIVNHEYLDAGGNVTKKGNGWFMAVNGETYNSTSSGLLNINGKVEEGKLYVEEKAGSEEVRYLERGGQVTTLTIDNGGTGYTTAPILTIVGTNTGQATATCTVSAGVITTVTITNSGNGYTETPLVTLSASAGTGGVITASILENNYIYTS